METFTSHGFMLWAVPRFHREPAANRESQKSLPALTHKTLTVPKEAVLTAKQDFSASSEFSPGA